MAGDRTGGLSLAARRPGLPLGAFFLEVRRNSAILLIKNMLRRALLVLAIGLLAADPAYAYIDPNMGGWLYQLLFPLLIAIAGAWAAFRMKISQFLAALAKKIRGK